MKRLFDGETVVAFNELLDQEVTVDVDKLRDLCRGGIPDDCRSRTYPLLLGVVAGDKTTEMTRAQSQTQTYLAVTGHPECLRSILSSDQSRGWCSRTRRKVTEAVRSDENERFLPLAGIIHTFSSPCRTVWEKGMALEAFVACGLLMLNVLDSPQDAFFCAQAVFGYSSQPHGVLCSTDSLRQSSADFCRIFRTLSPLIHGHLADEAVEFASWVPQLLIPPGATFFSDSMTVELCDYYVAQGNVLLHPFVIIACLIQHTDTILDKAGDAFISWLFEHGMSCLTTTHVLLKEAEILRALVED